MFEKGLFDRNGQWLYYNHNGERKFVARFKHRGPFTPAKFQKQLMKNHTPAEYFAKLENGDAPLAILRDADEAWYLNLLNR